MTDLHRVHAIAEFDAFANSLASVIPGNLVVNASIDSTNRLAKSVSQRLYSAESSPLTTWFLAFEQTAGRGRLGRQWDSSRGNGIYATLLFPLSFPGVAGVAQERLVGIPLAVGASACLALRQCTANDSIELKWPNDLLVQGRKLGGILIEVIDGPEEQRCLAVGIGVNYSHDQDHLPHENATSLKLVAENRLRPITDCAGLLCRSVRDELELARPLAEVLDIYRDLSVHRKGDSLTWSSSSGPVEGQFEGFDDRGSILIRTSGDGGEVLHVSAGDVLLPQNPSD